MTRWGVLLFLCCLTRVHGGRVRAAWAAPAGAGVEERVRARFETGRARDTAWGAWLAAEHGHPEFGADVARTLAAETRGAFGERPADRWVRDQVLLDAALRLRVPLDVPTLCRLAPRHRESVVVYLLDRDATDDEAVARVFAALDPGEGAPTYAWVALGDALGRSERIAPPFAERLLRRLRVGWRLTAYSADDTATAAPPPPPEGSLPACGCVERLPLGFPPVARHYLSLEPDGDRRRLGRTRVFARRGVIEDAAWGSTGVPDACPSAQLLIREWLGVPGLSSDDVLALKPLTEWTLDWSGRQPWNRLFQPRVDAVHGAWWRLLERLVQRGGLSGEGARRFEPALDVQVVDARRDDRPPLPPVPPSRVPNPFAPRPSTVVRDGV